MGGVGHAIGRVLSAPFRAVGHLFGFRSPNISQHATGASAAPGVDAHNNENNLESDAAKKKKKALGKKSLMIGNGSDSAGGGTTGTGLNL